MKTGTLAMLALLLARIAMANEMVPATAPEAQWRVHVTVCVPEGPNRESFTTEVCSEGTGYVFHSWNRGWKRNENEKTEIGLSPEDTARVYVLAAGFIRAFSVALKWDGLPGKELLAVDITMNGGGVSCRREHVQSASQVSPDISELIQIVNAALPKEKRIH